jgi:hypothetical protein
LYSQGNNYAPPINFDRFTNFFNYYWVAKSLPNTPALAWNPSLAPEYYTISAPKATDLDKLNVVAGTTRAIVLTGTGFYAQSWVVAFSDSTHFTVTASGAGLAPDEIVQSYTLPTIVAEQSSTYTVNFMASGAGEALLTFKIIRDPIYDGDGVWIGNESFAAGDSFTIAAPFLSSTYGVTPNVGPGVKGKINAVDSLDLYQVIDGVQIKENDRILVKNQGASVDNGIYVVKPGAFVRAADYPSTTDGARVFDRNRETLYVAQASGIWVADGSTSVSNTNDWQESNFWMHRDEATAAGLDLSKIIQATRPIIEYNSNLKLNTRFFIENSGIVGRMAAPTQPHAEAVGTPTDVGGTEYEQQKTDFNQAPQFDLYRYDGSHASLVSPIFFYMEDPTADIDPALQRRVAHASNASSDFLFGHGLIEEGNNLLFYKTIDGALHSIWRREWSVRCSSD